MPIKESAKKALRQSKKREKRNKKRKTAYKKLRKEILELVKQGKKEEAQKLLPEFQKAVDKAAKKNTVHQNKAARLKGQMAKKVHKS